MTILHTKTCGKPTHKGNQRLFIRERTCEKKWGRTLMETYDMSGNDDDVKMKGS